MVNQYVYYPDGSLKEAIGGGITYRYEYTKNGLLKSKSAQEKRLLDYFYDRNQNVIRLTDLTGKSTAYTYDTLDRLERVEDMESGEELAAYRYTPSGRKESLRLGNGVQTKYRYGEDGSLSSLVTVTPEGEVLLNYDYAYDGNGNCTKKSGERYQNEYAYDNMGRLLEAAYNGRKETYAYDLAGNRLKKETAEGTEVYSYNVKNQLLRIEKGGNATNFHYDPQGNMLEEAGGDRKEYAYDALNRLSSITSDVVIQKNHYDGELLRYETEENDKVIRFVFDQGVLSTENTTAARGNIRYIHGNNKVVCSERQVGDSSYHIQDEVGSTLFIMDREQNIRKRYRYDAFGRVLEEKGDIENRLTYTGQMYDGATGQYYLRARFYNPSVGRFLQEDVYRGDGLNLYTYCANNPVMYYDPSGYMGLCPVDVMAPGVLTEDEKKRMIIFPGDIVHPGTITPDNPEGIYTIKATGDYLEDRILLAKEAGINMPDSYKWRAHHIQYDPETNTMQMQFVDASYHSHPHFGGAGEFERMTGFKYGSAGAINAVRNATIKKTE